MRPGRILERATRSGRLPRPWPAATLLVAALALLAAGCMSSRDAINRVQPDYLDKAQLIPLQYAALATAGRTPDEITEDLIRREPQWLHQVTMIDKPATHGFSGVSSYTQLERIHWEVTENFLIARQSYDRLNRGQSAGPASDAWDNRAGPGNSPRQGEVLAVYAIRAHFDIRRAYNPTTGEELNIVEENTFDRPWYQRRFMRVDWSRNLVSGFSVLDFAEWQGRVRAEPVAYPHVDPSDPNRPLFHYGAFNGQDGVLTYFDVTNQAVFRPEEFNLAAEGFPNIPACLLFDRVPESCAPANITMRASFRRVDPLRDYEPQAIDGVRFDRFGFFTTNRVGFDPQRADVLNTERRYFSNRHNLWMQHHARPEDRAQDRAPAGALFHQPDDPVCRTDADCAVISPTARCDASAPRDGQPTCGERYVRCNADADCAAVGAGATCDLAIKYTRPNPERNTGLCLLPYRARQVRPIAYHLSPNYPERIMPVTNYVVREWHRAFVRAVQAARHRECMLDPGVTDRASCEAYRAPVTVESSDAGRAFVGCHNPVWGTDPGRPGYHSEAEIRASQAYGWADTARNADGSPVCGEQGTVARLGDLRFNMIASVNELDRNGPWGLATITGDPLTGEVFSGRGATWQQVTDLQAAYVTDLLRVINGDLSPGELANGANIVRAFQERYGTGLPGGREQASGAARRLDVRPVHRDIRGEDEYQTALRATDLSHLAQNVDPALHTLGALEALSRTTDARGRVTHSPRAYFRNLAQAAHRAAPVTRSANENPLERLRGTELERRLIGPEEIRAAGLDPALGLTDSVLDASSPARRNNMLFRSLRDRILRAAQARECNYEADLDDEMVVGLLRRFTGNDPIPTSASFDLSPEQLRFRTGTYPDGRPVLDYDKIHYYLTQWIGYGVILHELGHSVGERHNFAGSADAVNYDMRYWAARAARHGGDARMARPRFEYLRAGEQFYTQPELDAHIEEFSYSTVMDYQGFAEDGHGLGRYDHAFVKHGYVNMVEAFRGVAEPDTALNMFPTMDGGDGFLQVLQVGIREERPTSYHYTEIPRVIGATEMQMPDGGPRVTVPHVGDDNRFDVFLHETVKENFNLASGFDGFTPDHTNIATRGPDGASGGRYHVVPYRFATDNTAGVLWFNQRQDGGADMYETLRYLAERFMNYYFANSFGRERTSFTINSYRSRMRGRYLDALYYVSRVAAVYDLFTRNGFWTQEPAASQPAAVSRALGIATMVDTMTNAILMPEWRQGGDAQGTWGYALTPRPGPDGRVIRVWDESFSGPLRLRIGDGRIYESRWDWESGGGFWRDRMINVGSYHDKLLGLEYLTETFLYAPERDLGDDLRFYQVNMSTIYPAQTIRFFGSLLSRDHDDIAPQVRNVASAEPEILRTQVWRINLPQGTGAMQNGRDPALSAINPATNFTTELWAAVYAMANLSRGYNQQFVQYARLWVDGDASALEPPPGARTVAFTDPFTLRTFRALHFGRVEETAARDPGVSPREAARMPDPATALADGERGVAARMLLHASDLRRAWETAPAAARERRATELRQYVDVLDAMRTLGQLYGTGTGVR